MRRCILLFFCVSVAACSPKHFTGERTVQSTQHSVMADSASVSRWLRETVSQIMTEQTETMATTETETVREIFSAPDTSGVQYVVERDVTRQTAKSKTSTGRKASTAAEKEEKADSLQTVQADVDITSTASETVQMKKRRPFPWWCYLVMACAALAGGYFLYRKVKIV